MDMGNDEAGNSRIRGSRSVQDYEGDRTVTTGTGQIHYCQVCVDLIKFLTERMIPHGDETLRPGEYEVNIRKLRSRGNCCLCALLLKAVDDNMHAEPDDDFGLNPNIQMLKISSYGRSFHVDYMESTAQLLFHTTPPNSSFKYSSYPHFVPKSTDSEECWKLANKWLANCIAGHDCMPIEGQLPTRLIKINPTAGSFHPYLVESTSELGTVRYCTLSHCWGDGDFLQLVQHNYDAFHRSIPYQRLSKTFRDALYAAHRMGFEYIWVDSLCIIQQDKEDWSREAATMSKIYSGSSLNLAAASSTDGRSGMFHQRDPTTVVPCVSPYPGFNDIDFLICNQRLFLQEIDASPLLRRAWVVQERYLAPRTLYFETTQLFWECLAGCACESRPWDPMLGMNNILYTITSSRKGDLLESWSLVLGHYTRSQLSFESDKLVAVSGIAKHLSKDLGQYFAGLWRDNIELQLLWEVSFNQWGVRPAEYRAPSWSWAAIDGSIFPCSSGEMDMDDRHFQGFWMSYKVQIKVLDGCIVPKVAGDAFGELLFASLIVRCGQLKVLSSLEHNRRGEVTELFNGKETIHIHFDALEGEKNIPKEVFLMNILAFDCLGSYGQPYPAGVTGLLLAPSELGVGFYSRVGRFWIDKHPSPRMSRAEASQHIETGTQVEVEDVNIRNGYRSSLWAGLPNARMFQKSPQGDSLEEERDELEERFIITLV